MSRHRLLVLAAFVALSLVALAALKSGKSVTFLVVTPDGEPAEGVMVGTYADWSGSNALPDGNPPMVRFAGSGSSRNAVTDADGHVTVAAKDLFPSWHQDNDPITVYAVDAKNQLACFDQITPDTTSGLIQLSLEPACNVSGRLVSSGLERIGRELKWTNVYVYHGNDRPLVCMSETQEFAFLLPPGKYKLYAYGTDVYTATPEIEVAPGQTQLDTTVDLPPSRLAQLFGQPAPEFQQIKGWKNGEPVTLAELRGKVVVLDFWGYWCGPCIQSMPKLMDLHDRYADEGLVIVAVHDDSVGSIEEMDRNLASARARYWNGRDIPFLVALDGGGATPILDTETEARGATTAAFGIQSFPTSVLVDRQGRVVEQFHPGGKDYERKLRTLLGIGEDLTDRFEALYRLDERQVLKRISPEQTEVRRDHLLHFDPGERFMALYWRNGDGLITNRRYPFERVTLGKLLDGPLVLSPFEYELTPQVKNLEMNGDWIVRRSASSAELVAALERIIADEFDGRVRFVREQVERDVIVARGRFDLRPLTGTYRDGPLHVYSDTLDDHEQAGGGSGNVREFLCWLGEGMLEQQVVNLLESGSNTEFMWDYHRSGYIRKLRQGPERRAKLQLLLQNISEQTGVRFAQERRVVDVWRAAP